MSVVTKLFIPRKNYLAGSRGQLPTKAPADELTNYLAIERWANSLVVAGGIIAFSSFNVPGLNTYAPSAGSTPQAVDHSNIFVKFTAPPSGTVFVDLSVFSGADNSGTAFFICIGLIDHANSAIQYGDMLGTVQMADNSAGDNITQARVTCPVLVQGLTANKTYTMDAAMNTQTGGPGIAQLLVGQASLHGLGGPGPFIMRVLAL